MNATLWVWTIYARPADLPHEPFVIRPHAIRPGNAEPKAVGCYWGAKTLAEARAKLPPGLVCVPRDPSDPPHVVESWM